MNKHEYPGFASPPQHRHKPLERKRTELAPGVYAFVGYGSSNFGAIATPNGYILIDSGDNLSGSAAALAEIKALAPGTLQALILTHSHPDHRGGGAVFLEGREEVPIWGAANFGAEQKAVEGLEEICKERAGKQFGVGIPDKLYPVNRMLPRFPYGESGPLVFPNRFAATKKTVLNIDEVTLELHAIPGESTDHLVVWLPGQKVLFSGDHIYRSFPNIYPIRGGAFRDVEQWAEAVRRLMEFNPKAMMFGHNDVPEAEEIMPMLEKYARAIEHVYTETIRGMNAGKTPDDLAANVSLPQDLREEPFLGEFYGSSAWTVRSIYAHKLGWFDGNPTNLVPLAPKEEAERMARLAGGKTRLVEAAQNALAADDCRWAARLADCLSLLGEAKQGERIKADALENISRNILPVSGKNYLLRSALDLRKKQE